MQVSLLDDKHLELDIKGFAQGVCGDHISWICRVEVERRVVDVDGCFYVTL